MGRSPLQMVAMSVLVLLLTMTMLMKSEAASAQITTVSENSAETVLQSPDLEMRGIMEYKWDVRWTHRHLVLSLKRNTTMCQHGRCELQRDGSLRFSRVQVEDAGNYSMEVFYENGTQLMRREFVVRVEAADTSSSVGVPVSISCLVLFLLLVFIIIFILKRRRMKTNTSGQMEEKVYVRMQSSHGNEGKDEGEKTQEKEEESVYVLCHPGGFTKTPITKQTSAEGDDIYV